MAGLKKQAGKHSQPPVLLGNLRLQLPIDSSGRAVSQSQLPAAPAPHPRYPRHPASLQNGRGSITRHQRGANKKPRHL